MSILLNGNCLELLDTIEDNSVDLIYCDLPYATDKFGSCTACEWDKPINLEELWSKLMKKKKINTPIFMSCNVKLGYELIRTAPKKCPFRYDLIWVKSTKAGFLSSKRMPLRSHELVYVFYEKLPFYDLSSHTHKFLNSKNGMKGQDNLCYGSEVKQVQNKQYDPPLPHSVIKEDCYNYKERVDNGKLKETGNAQFEGANGQPLYDPPLPNSILEIKSTRGKHSTEKPVDLIKWILKYYSKEGDIVLDPTMGSGSSGVACKEMKRDFIGIEMNPEIYEVAVNRIEG
jgi:site-specific DNA-methyltransferase (adenine-specific)